MASFHGCACTDTSPLHSPRLRQLGGGSKTCWRHTHFTGRRHSLGSLPVPASWDGMALTAIGSSVKGHEANHTLPGGPRRRPNAEETPGVGPALRGSRSCRFCRTQDGSSKDDQTGGWQPKQLHRLTKSQAWESRKKVQRALFGRDHPSLPQSTPGVSWQGPGLEAPQSLSPRSLGSAPRVCLPPMAQASPGTFRRP